MADTEEAQLRKYPRKVTRLLNSMKKARKRIKEIREHLKSAQSEYDGLEIEWKEYQASIAAIRTCPNEILSIIFHFCLLENPRLARRMLLVCKQWYAIVVNDPRMWNRILVTIPDEWDIQPAAPPIKSRIKRCLERSGTLLLNLDLDLSSLRSADNQIIEKIRMSFLHEVSEEDWGTIYEWAGYSDVEGLLESATTTDYLPESMLKVVHQLIGHNGKVMDRWGTVKIQFPETNMPFVWRMFAWPAPNLSSIAIRWSDIMGEHLEELAAGFPDVPSLKHLDVSDIDSLEFLHLEHSSIESLRLEVSSGHQGANDLEGLSLTLPKLCHFVLRGDIENLDVVDFQVPILRTLDLVRWYHFGFAPLPRLQSLHVRWKLKEGWEEDWSPAILLIEMKRILAQYGTAVNLTVDDLAKSALTEAIQSLRVDGEWKSALKTIVVEKLGGESETFLVSSLY